KPHSRESLIPHVMHTLTAVRQYDDYESLCMRVRIDVAMALIEAPRFSGVEWKRLAIS
ncbi:hypothetical protein BDP81DRAFT_315746, partial [Colletotrichum phormii]